jgi:hypothetical protein
VDNLTLRAYVENEGVMEQSKNTGDRRRRVITTVERGLCVGEVVVIQPQTLLRSVIVKLAELLPVIGPAVTARPISDVKAVYRLCLGLPFYSYFSALVADYLESYLHFISIHMNLSALWAGIAQLV